MPASASSKRATGKSPPRALGGGNFRPGERIREIEICKWLEMSRTPVREALRRLEADGLLEDTPHAGMLVTPVDREMVAELSWTRTRLIRRGNNSHRQCTTDA